MPTGNRSRAGTPVRKGFGVSVIPATPSNGNCVRCSPLRESGACSVIAGLELGKRRLTSATVDANSLG